MLGPTALVGPFETRHLQSQIYIKRPLNTAIRLSLLDVADLPAPRPTAETDSPLEGDGFEPLVSLPVISWFFGEYRAFGSIRVFKQGS